MKHLQQALTQNCLPPQKNRRRRHDRREEGIHTMENTSIFEVHHFTEPELPFITFLNYKIDRLFLCSNFHSSVEIICVLDGQCSILIDTARFHALPGDIFIFNSGAVHIINAAPSVTYHCFIIGTAFFRENKLDAASLSFKPFLRDTAFTAILDKAAKVFLQTSPDNPLRPALLRKHMQDVLLHMCQNHLLQVTADKSSGAPTTADCIRAGLNHINLHYGDTLSLSEISEVTGMSKFHFARQFKRYTGHTVVTYVNLIRCQAAARMLTSTSLPIGDIARRCGYENMSYFTRAFKRHLGVLPSHYRENMKNAPPDEE